MDSLLGTRTQSYEPVQDRQGLGFPFRRDSMRAGRQNLNRIKTAKYEVHNFVCKNLLEQFRKQANFYFLIISAVMYVGEKTPLFVPTIKAWSTAGTLAIMIMVSMTLAMYDDYNRHVDDKNVNEKKFVEKLKCEGQMWQKDQDIEWQALEEGDLVKLRAGDEIPADIVVLACDNGETAFVSTAGLDGETSLKPKAPALRGAQAKSENPRIVAQDHVVKEPPTNSIYTFNGSLELQSGKQSLEMRHVLLRGSVLRNTRWCIGIVIYHGQDTRIMQNSRETPVKQPNFELVINKAMWVAIFSQTVLALITDVVYNVFYKDEFRKLDYLYPGGYQAPAGRLPDIIGYFLTYFVLYSNLMPVSLYASMEFCNAAYAVFVANDPNMVFKVDGVDDQPAVCRATNLGHELGQVSYIFSDKTGTLTQNLMSLKFVSVGGKVYTGVSANSDSVPGIHPECSLSEGVLRSSAESANEDMERLLVNLTLNHSVMLNEDGEFEAESAEEETFLKQAGLCGWDWTGRTTTHTMVKVRGERRAYEVLATNAFTSARKCMSVIVRTPAGTILLLIKGADDALLEKSADDPDGWILDDIERFAKVGLRCLVFGWKELTSEDWEDWARLYQAAGTAMEERAEKLAGAADVIERGLCILGSVAIEDKLQDGVPDAIDQIRKAGIKFWMLTGDKMDTAKAVGFSSRVLKPDTKIVKFEDAASVEEGRLQRLDASKAAARGAADDDALEVGSIGRSCPRATTNTTRLFVPEGGGEAIMISGVAITKVMATESSKAAFLNLAQKCDVVIASRVSPLQKGQLVRLVREGVKLTKGVLKEPVTLAIGDGANDVPMIQEAQVGIGVYGREGRQAVNASDFAIGQFRFLERLLLVHGRWNYRRSAKFTLFTFWRNAVQVILMCFYTFFSGFSGTALFEDMLRITFNPIGSLAIMATGMIDQDVRESMVKVRPELYQSGRLGLDLRPQSMLETMLSALTHSMIIWGVMYYAFPAMDILGEGDYWSFCVATYSALMVCLVYRNMYLNTTWSALSLISVVAMVVGYLSFLFVYDNTSTKLSYKVPSHLAGNAVFWTCMFVVPALQLAVDLVVWHYYHETIRDDDDGSAELSEKPAASDSIMFTRQIDALNYKHWNTGQPPEENDKSLFDFSFASFKKQRGYSVQMVWTPNRAIASQVVISLSLLVLSYGVRCKQQYGGQVSVGIQYAGKRVASGHAHQHFADCHHGTCEYSFILEQSIEPPVLLYYTVAPFYQNYNDYLTNLSLVKRSRFTDSFEIKGKTLSREDVAWPSDKLMVSKLYGEDEGNRQFEVWMRPGAMSTLNKRYAWLKEEGLQKGTNVTVRIKSYFDVSSFGGSKTLVLTHLSEFGAENTHFDEVLLASAGLCGLAAIIMQVLKKGRADRLRQPQQEREGL